jgi:hypothetical protein
MSTKDKQAKLPVAPVSSPLPLRELAEVLVKHYGLHEGSYDLLVELQVGLGGVGPDPLNLSPGAMIGVHRIGLQPAQAQGPTTVDAALVNPKKRTVRNKADR